MLLKPICGDDQFGDITLLAMKMRATDNLQRSSRMVNCIVTRKLKIWDAAVAGLHRSRNPSHGQYQSAYGAKIEDPLIGAVLHGTHAVIHLTFAVSSRMPCPCVAFTGRSGAVCQDEPKTLSGAVLAP